MPRVNQQTRSATRLALLDSAAQAFAEHGYHETAIDSVSEAAGVAKGTIYNYFSSKEDILRALIKEACQLAIDSATAISDSASTHARLQDFVAGNLRWARQRRPLALLFARELLAGDAQMKALIAEAAAPCVTKVAAIMHTGIERGEITPYAPPGALALTFIALTNMLLLQSWDGLMPWPPDATLPTTATALFLHGIAPRTS
ncbi:MAG: TetR/AcrR family transcriptional regulator [Actinomycetota bacterium]|nr:TetR/AcrR family transcriptional regulator [Actinomycetota bacterium]